MMTSGTGRREVPRGFTLIEVLVGFAILMTSLVLIASGLSRHLAALQLLRGDLLAAQLSNQQLIQEIVRRRDKLLLPLETPPEGFTTRLKVIPVRLEPEPIQELSMDQAEVEVSWVFRTQGRTTKLSSGFSPEGK